MKVRFEQSGGWGNPLGRVCELDTQHLDPNEAEQLQTLVAQSQIEESTDARSPEVRDAVNYEIVIEEGEQAHRIRADDMTLPDSARPLVKFLQSRAKPRTLK